MSGKNIPYQLRPNKAVDRYAFIELLAKIDNFPSILISKYQYIGFGGYSLEDFKYIHARFNIRDMISIEKDEEVYKRQQFNQPHNCIDCHKKSSDEFIREFERKLQTIIWLDYTGKELKSQMEEFQVIISKLEPFDIIKLTVRSHAPDLLKEDEASERSKLHEERMNLLKEKLGNYFPGAEVTENMMTNPGFPYAILLVIKNVADQAMEGQSDICFQPLSTFTYHDGDNMLTVTGIILKSTQICDFLKQTDIETWELSNTKWGKPRQIDIPNFTIKERLYIDSLLPNKTATEIQEELDLLFDETKNKTIAMLENYILFYRQSPYFSKIIF